MFRKLSLFTLSLSRLLQPFFWRRVAVLALIALLAWPAAYYQTTQATQEPAQYKVVINAFDDIKRHLSTKLLEVIEGWKIKRLQVAFDGAQKAFEKGDVCASAQTLNEALRLIQSFAQEKRQPLLEDFFNSGWTLRQTVLGTQAEGKTCQGAEGFNREPEATERESDNRQFQTEIKFGEPSLNTILAEGQTFTQVELPGAQTTSGEPGLPGVPVYRQLIALPQGAKAYVRAKANGEQQFKLKLYPIQPEPMDRAVPQEKGEKFPAERFQEPPFTINKEVYGQDGPFPRQICTITPMGQARELSVAQLSCAAGQYNPAQESLTVFQSLDVEVSFEGGDGIFTHKNAAEAFEASNSYAAAVLNKSAVARYVGQADLKFWYLGEEFLILTHPNFRAAADRLAAWKNSKGIMTRVVNVNDGSGSGPDTRAQIDSYIENEYARSLIRPSYILLMGDAEFIAPFYVNTSGSATTGTDYPYALLSSQGDDVADFALGRIPVDTLAQADVVVDKIINYEQTPPWNSGFYRNAAVASQFQCCRSGGLAGRDERSFIETSELARNQMAAQGKTVERIYTRTGSGTPTRYYNGTLLPAALGSGSGFAWDGDVTDIVNTFNAGRFLILHRDHGWEDGWANPSFTSTNVTNDLHNGSLLPVVFSVNCASGLFDNETAGGDYGTNAGSVYFAERLLRKSGGGAVGMLGDTRNSPTWANSALTRGFFDAVWPNTLPAYGPAVSHRRLGDILNYGKAYLATQVGVAGTTEATSAWDLTSELYLWHVIGDPTLEMWTSNPHAFTIDPNILVKINKLEWQIRFPYDEAVVTAFQETRTGPIPIGRGVVKNGEASFSLVNLPRPGADIKFVANVENGVSIPLKVTN
ncbi:MAG: C25 family cysteine peptidase [Acidobacteriota bacterium]